MRRNRSEKLNHLRLKVNFHCFNQIIHSKRDYVEMKVGKLITKVFGSKSEKDIKGIQPIVDKIKAFGPDMESLSDQELQAKTQGFKEKIQEATAEVRAEIKEIKARLEHIEKLNPTENRRLGEELDQLEQEELDIIEDVLNDILPESICSIEGYLPSICR